jgi:glycosyltransferase involved in cell wall biosynthesis
MQLLFSLNSLAAQTDAPAWEAIVVGEGGSDLGPLLAAHPYRDHVRFVRMDETAAPAAARNLGMRLANGRIITYLEAGNSFAPHHFAQLARAFETGAAVVRSDVRLLLCESYDGTPNTVHHETTVNGIVRGAGDDERDLVAATVPIDAIAHLAAATERIGRFRTDLPVAEVWEFWLRLRPFAPAFLPGPAVDVRILRGCELPNPAYLNMSRSIYTAYPAPEGSDVGARRAMYLDEMQGHYDRGVAAIVDTAHSAEVLATLFGIESPVLT